MRRFDVVGFGDGSIECDVAEAADMGMIELEDRFDVVTGGDSGSDGRMNGVVWYSEGRPREVTIEVNRVICLLFRKKRNTDMTPNIRMRRDMTITAVAPLDKPLRPPGRRDESLEFPTTRAFELPPCFPRASTCKDNRSAGFIVCEPGMVLEWRMNPPMVSRTIHSSFVRCDVQQTRCETHKDLDRLGSSRESCNRILSENGVFSTEYASKIKAWRTGIASKVNPMVSEAIHSSFVRCDV
jgi:hypothetical protein